MVSHEPYNEMGVGNQMVDFTWWYSDKLFFFYSTKMFYEYFGSYWSVRPIGFGIRNNNIWFDDIFRSWGTTESKNNCISNIETYSIH